jgi:plasmid replication initiation protein
MEKDVRLKKANEVIHISNKLSLLERKLFNSLLWSAYPDLLKKSKHRISRKELGKLVGFDSNDTRLLKEALRKLRETEIEWVTMSGSNEDWTTSGFIASGRLTKGACEYSFSAHLTELLHHPKFYTRFFLEVQRKLSSYQALALYENTARFKRVKSTGWVDVDTWRELLGVADMPSYSNFKVFNSRVIKRAVQDINKFSDISLIPEYKREARRITKIRFKIKRNSQPNLFGEPPEDDDDDNLEERYREVAATLTEEQMKALLERFETEIVENSPVLRKRYEEDGFEQRIVQYSFQQFVLDNQAQPDAM